MKRLKKILLIFMIVVIVIAISGLIYLKTNTYQALYEDQTFLESSTISKNIRIFEPLGPIDANIIFYPGGLVERDSYAYLAFLLAQEGFRVFLVGMPLNLAIINGNAARDIINDYPSSAAWFLGGHSLGGATASLFAFDHHQTIDGLFFLGAYPANSADLSDVALKVISITATQDLILDAATYEKTKALLPVSTIYHEIDGGNHSYFGFYGQQKGDGIATITAMQQHEDIVARLKAWIMSS